MKNLLPNLNIQTSFVDITNLKAVEDTTNKHKSFIL